MTNEPTAGRHSRRSMLRAVAWSAPAAVAVSATPAFAASNPVPPRPRVNLWTQAFVPNETRDGLHNTEPYYQGPRTLTFTFTYGNFGPDAMPAGAIISLDLPFASIWGAPTISGDPAGKGPVFVSATNWEGATDPLMMRRTWDYRLSAPVAAGTQFQITYRIALEATFNTATNHYRARPLSRIGVGAVAVTETTSDNNSDYTDTYMFFNNQNALP